MSLLVVLGIALALAMDAFAVSLGIALVLKGLTAAQSFRMALYFGLFQFGMPVLGWFAGTRILGLIERADHWVAMGLLAFVGGRMIYESFHLNAEEKASRPDQTRGKALLLLAVATSIDALAVGLSLGVVSVPILVPALIIGLVCFGVTLVGARLGPALGRALGKRAELAGGVVLIAIGVRILVQHLSKN
ncbi:MAG: manganese efflux pump MntP family protein [Candidatus Aminicenantes bacterium]|nr:manganese efflux pump MntP family protein [Candidatus Aminicenantes bacterium]